MRSLKPALVYLENPRKDIYAKPGYNSEHLGICYLGAVIRQAGFPVTFIDGAAEGLSSEEVLTRIRLSQADFVGFSITCATITDALSISRQLKAERPGIHICLGGHHATFAARAILENEDCIDSIVRGDGEVTIIQLLTALQGGGSLEGIRGIYSRHSDGTVLTNEDRPVVSDLDALPFPARDVLESRISQGLALGVVISSSRGCPYRCRFCSTPEFYRLQSGSYWRARSAMNVVDEIQLLYEKYGLTEFDFVDDNCVLPTHESKQRLRDIATEILQRGLKINLYILSSVSVFGPRDEQLLNLLRTAGMNRIFLGIESGYQPTLNLYGKPASPERNLAAVDFLSKSGFLLMCSTILFHPYATLEELRENSRFIRRLMDKPTVGMFAPYCRRLEVYPGIEIFEDIKRDGLLLSDKPYLDAYAYNFVSPTVQLLADTMWNLLPSVVDTDWLIWDTRQLLLNIISYAEQLDSQGLCIGQVRKECQQIIEEINRVNFDFFTLALELAEQNKQSTLKQEGAEYLRQLKAKDALLRQQYTLLEGTYPLVAELMRTPGSH